MVGSPIPCSVLLVDWRRAYSLLTANNKFVEADLRLYVHVIMHIYIYKHWREEAVLVTLSIGMDEEHKIVMVRFG